MSSSPNSQIPEQANTPKVEATLKPVKPFLSFKAVRGIKAFALTSIMVAPLFIYIKYWIVPEAENRYESMWQEARNRGYVYDPTTNPSSVVTVAPNSKPVSKN